MADQAESRHLDVIDDALRQGATTTRTRRWLLERAAAGAAGAAAAGLIGRVATASAQSNGSPIRRFGTVAATTEALTVTLLAELLRRVNSPGSMVPADVKGVFEGAYAAEVDHLRWARAHWHPSTTRFWLPDAFFGGPNNTVDLTAVGKALVAGETIFTNFYLIGITTFAQARRATFARYCGELAGVESEHRVLARTLLHPTPPNDLGFAVYALHTPAAIIKALEQAGIGFGTMGAAPGAFYTLAQPVMPPPLKIRSNKPR
jgi:hypothetical protein